MRKVSRKKTEERNILIDALMIVPGLVLTGLVAVKILPASIFYYLFALQCGAIIYLGFIAEYLPGYNKKQGLAYAYRGKIAEHRATGLLLFTVANFLFNLLVLPSLF